MDLMNDRLSAIQNFVAIDDRLATAGQPNPFQFGLIKAAGYSVVINLALSSSTDALNDENALAKSAWLEYVHIPVVWEKPTMMDFELFAQVMKRRQTQKCFIHCAKNMRVSVFVYLWRRIYEKVPHDIAQASIDAVWIPNDIWQLFLESVLKHHENLSEIQSNSPQSSS
jgi:protein tyrosine phosphatase (PTP) superfamily phosphohydrolase (DUF442 family)